ncbi:MAG TPA: adenylyl-sulfate kinase, partial [Verrucomicrobiae bacterium]
LARREARNQHRGCVLWFTGLSASGKSTVANELEAALFKLGCQTFVLDGDRVRHGLCNDLAFSEKDRHENIRRVGEVAKLFSEAGFICIAAFISPYRADRALVRGMAGRRFVEVFVNAPLAVCESRDPKGLYAKARAHEIRNFTGVSAPYETPLKPEVELRTDQLSVAAAVTKTLAYLRKKKFIQGR